MQIEFYKAVSQILPILFLGVSIQSIFAINGVKYDKEETFSRNIHIMGFIALICILILGETVALKCIFQNEASTKDLELVIFTMSVSILWITVEYLLLLLGKSKEIYYLGLLLIGVIAIIFFTVTYLIN